MTDKNAAGLALLRKPFPANQISKLPKPTKMQTDAVRNDFKTGIRCEVCGGWHHPKVVHLDYVGHAALTDRLLDADPEWSWTPVAWNEDGTPKIDGIGGMWIALTVCGTTRLGYGSAEGKHGGDAVKELIGDALRNAAMRFGAALDLWHKGDLHGAPDEAWSDPSEPDLATGVKGVQVGPDDTPAQKAEKFADGILEQFSAAKTLKGVEGAWKRNEAVIARLQESYGDLYANVLDAYKARTDALTEATKESDQ